MPQGDKAMEQSLKILPCDYTRCTGIECPLADDCARYWAGVYDKCDYAPWTEPSEQKRLEMGECDLFIDIGETGVKIPCQECGGDGYFYTYGDPNSDEVVICESCGGSGFANNIP